MGEPSAGANPTIALGCSELGGVTGQRKKTTRKRKKKKIEERKGRELGRMEKTWKENHSTSYFLYNEVVLSRADIELTLVGLLLRGYGMSRRHDLLTMPPCRCS